MSHTDDLHPNLKQFSNSSLDVQARCDREYELYKLGDQDDGENEDTRFGHVVGLGVQRLLMSGDRNAAYMDALLSWKPDLDEVDDPKKKKSFWHTLIAIDGFVGIKNTILKQFELAVFDGKPAVELGFSIDLGDGFAYRGFLDALLINRLSGELVVYEGKTTKYKQVGEAEYKHSGQAVGYSVLVDTIAAKLGLELKSSFKVYYFIWSTTAQEWIYMPFTKTHTDRALWLQNLMMRKEWIQLCGRYDYFPMNGKSCMRFFRPCNYFDTCTMSNAVLVPNPKVRVDAPEKYPFKYTWEEVAQVQLERQGEDR